MQQSNVLALNRSIDCFRCARRLPYCGERPTYNGRVAYLYGLTAPCVNSKSTTGSDLPRPDPGSESRQQREVEMEHQGRITVTEQ
jgi:hypothetical protein